MLINQDPNFKNIDINNTYKGTAASSDVTTSLDLPHPALRVQPDYKVTRETVANSDSAHTDIASVPSDIASASSESDWITSADDDIRFSEDSDIETDSSVKPLDTPLCNILHNHPWYNRNDPEYQKSLQDIFLGMTTPNRKMVIPTPTINVPLVTPEQITVCAAADTCSQIQAIGHTPTVYYKNKGMIKHDKTGITVSTGNGKVKVHEYLPASVRTKDGKIKHTKFWCLVDLPTFDWLIGNTLLNALGWELTNKFYEYTHEPQNIDHQDDELDTLLCSRYPKEDEPDIDISKVIVKEPQLRDFIHERLSQYQDVLAKHEWDSGKMLKFEFPINFIEEPHPLKQGFLSKEYWMNMENRVEVQKQIDGMRKFGLVEKCTNPQWVSSLFCVSKKTGDVRIVFDYRKLNLITRKMKHPIPDARKLLSKFKGKPFITSLDMKGGFWHCPIKKEHRNRTAFIFNNEIYQWKVMPFGPTNSPMFFQQCMQEIFGKLPFVVVYIDDISIMSNTVEEHKQHVDVVFKLLREHCIKLRMDKCIWGVSETEYLGFIVDKTGVCPKSSYIQKILDIPQPSTKKSLQRFLGLVQFLHTFMPQIHHQYSILSPLTGSNKPKKISMNEVEVSAFTSLKGVVSDAKYLLHPDLSKHFHVFTDASKAGIGGMLAQYDDQGRLRPVSFCSKVFNGTQQRWHVSEQEIYGAIYSVERWSELLRHAEFTLHTDHKNLEKLLNHAVDFKSGKLFRWAVRLQDYHFKCQYIKGEDNVVADFLSRESAMLQSPQYQELREFYGANPNPIREQLSNNGGIDIHALYMSHAHLEMLNKSNPNFHFFGDRNPYRVLTDQSKESNPLSLQMQHYAPTETRVMYENNGKWHDRTSECLVHRTSMPEPYSSSDDDSDISSVSSMSSASDLSSVDAFEDDDILQKAPLRKHRYPTRHSINAVPKPRHKKLTIPRRTALSSKQLKVGDSHNRREFLRRQQKLHNQKLVDEKPWDPTWNANILLPRYRVPIRSYYGDVISDNSKLSSEFIHAKQTEDWFCWNIIEFLETGNKAPIEGLLPYLKRYVLSGRFFLDTNKMLCFKHIIPQNQYAYKKQKLSSETSKQTRAQNKLITRSLRVVPSSLVGSVLTYAHDLHNGSSKMLRVITSQLGLWWPRMHTHIQTHAQVCNTCQHVKHGSHIKYKNTGKMKMFKATAPFQQISVDIVGPMPISHSSNRYIVSMIDKFSRYCMLVPVKSVSSTDVIHAIDRWITTFGAPKSILSDNGPQFISAIYADYMKNHGKGGIKTKYSSTYYPQSNGQIERLPRWIKERLSLIAYDGGLNFVDGTDDWSDYLSIIQLTYNSTPNQMTTYTPMKIVLGRDVYTVRKYKFDPELPGEYIRYLTNRQMIIEQDANERQKIYDDLRKQQHDKGLNVGFKEYEVHQRVLWNINSSYQGNAKKFGPKWVGPYEITDIFNDRQSFEIKMIPLYGTDIDNPMNKQKIPRKGKSHRHRNRNPNAFTVPRVQIKPYYDWFEQTYDGFVSPSTAALQTLDESIKTHLNTLHVCNTQIWKQRTKIFKKGSEKKLDRLWSLITLTQAELDNQYSIQTRLKPIHARSLSGCSRPSNR